MIIENILGSVFGCFRLIAGLTNLEAERIQMSKDIQKKVVRGVVISDCAQSSSSDTMNELNKMIDGNLRPDAAIDSEAVAVDVSVVMRGTNQ